MHYTFFCPKTLTIPLKAVKQSSDKAGEILVCCVHIYISSNDNQSLWVKVCHGVTSVESLVPSNFHLLNYKVSCPFSYSVHEYSLHANLSSPPRTNAPVHLLYKLHVTIPHAVSTVWVQQKRSELRQNADKTSFSHQASELGIINREELITYLFVLKIAEKVILKNPPLAKRKSRSV